MSSLGKGRWNASSVQVIARSLEPRAQLAKVKTQKDPEGIQARDRGGLGSSRVTLKVPFLLSGWAGRSNSVVDLRKWVK